MAKTRWSTLECLRGDAGPKFQRTVANAILNGTVSCDGAAKREYNRLVARLQEQHATRAATPDTAADKARLRREILSRIR
jgi:endonuclease YncB( thermonuclease family)